MPQVVRAILLAMVLADQTALLLLRPILLPVVVVVVQAVVPPLLRVEMGATVVPVVEAAVEGVDCIESALGQ